MNLFKEQFDIVVTTSQGLERVTAEEIKNIGVKDVLILNRAISFHGDMEILYKANLSLRTALRVLVPIATFRANDDKELYQKIYYHNWAQYFTYKNTIAINAVSNSQIFNHSHYVSLKVKDAIVDNFRNKFSIRPSVNLDSPDIRINVHINDNQVTVSLDSSGDPLFKRGYRKLTALAPLNEVLAAGLILNSDWDKKTTFLDPMCGSGTIPIEAAMIANNISPGLIRQRYSFMFWKNFDNKLYSKLVENLKSSVIKVPVKILASDIDSNSIRIAKDNANRAGVEDIIKFSVSDFTKLELTDKKGVIVSNPPYGERLNMEDIDQFYSMIGDFLKRNCKGYSAWIISSNFNALKKIGLHPSKKILLFNGQLKCQFSCFEIYEGSKKTNKMN